MEIEKGRQIKLMLRPLIYMDSETSVSVPRTIGLLTVANFESISSSILVQFSRKKCSNGGKNERE